jgi:aryl-alcohol dehydrogenase-like predicted oxidoreductase
MKYRMLPNSELRLSEIGYSLRRLVDQIGRRLSETEAQRLLGRCFDVGVTLFQTGDTFGFGASEELLAKALRSHRDEVVIATLVGYDFYHRFENKLRTGQEVVPDFSPAFIRLATEQALRRLKTDRIEILQLHHPGRAEVEEDAVWETLAALRREGKILHFGAAFGPARGWLYESVDCLQHRAPAIVEQACNLFEPFPTNQVMRATYFALPEPGLAVEELPDFQHGRTSAEPQFKTRLLVRDPLCRGILIGNAAVAGEHPEWMRAARDFEFLTGKETGRTLGQAALLWLLAERTVASCLVEETDAERLAELAAAPERNRLTREELERVDELHERDRRAQAEPLAGTMKRP